MSLVLSNHNNDNSLIRTGDVGSQNKNVAGPSTVRLRGHKSAVLTTKFNESSTFLASGGLDKHLAIWNLQQNAILEPDNFNSLEETEIEFNYLQLHKSAITSLGWSNLAESLIFTASADKTACCFDLLKSQKVKTFKHKSCINQLDISRKDLVLTATDTEGVKLWDLRSKYHVGHIPSKYPVLTCCIDNKNDTRLYFAGVDPTVQAYDIRQLGKASWSECNHTDSVTSLHLSQNDDYLFSKSLDGTVKYYDSRLNFAGKRSKPYIFDGSKSSQEDLLIRSILIENDNDDANKLVVSGSNDGFVYVWDFVSRKLIDRFDGHSGSVLDVDYSKQLNKLATTSNDSCIILRDL